MCSLSPCSLSGQFFLEGHLWELLGALVSVSLQAVSSPPRYFSHSLPGPGAKAPGFPACLLVQSCPAGLQRVAKLVSFLLRREGLLPGLGGVRSPRWDRGGGSVAPGTQGPAPPSQPLTQLGGSICPAWQGWPGASRLPSLRVGAKTSPLKLFFPMVSGGGYRNPSVCTHTFRGTGD